jgi:hypothetical protein
MTINTKVITVLNEGLSAIDAIENYNKKTTVRDIEAYVYDSFGNEIKKNKERILRTKAQLARVLFFPKVGIFI